MKELVLNPYTRNETTIEYRPEMELKTIVNTSTGEVVTYDSLVDYLMYYSNTGVNLIRSEQRVTTHWTIDTDTRIPELVFVHENIDYVE